MFPIAYTCTLSDDLREAVAFTGSHSRIQSLVEGIVKQFDEDKELKKEVKVMLPGHRVMRQVDIRTDEHGILLKCFVNWNFKINMWHVFVEAAHETFWEKNRIGEDGGTMAG